MNTGQETKEYWEENIEKYGKFYDKQSEEDINAHWIVEFFYQRYIFPKEKKVTLDRYKKTINFIRRNVKEGMKTVDLGCGTGIFTTELLLRDTKVFAVDYVESALLATKRRVKEILPEKEHNVEYLLLDIMKDSLPKSDLVLAIGVTPYIDSLELFFAHILPTTNRFYCLFLDDKNWMNKIRKNLWFLNVRRYRFFDTNLIDKIPRKYGFERISREMIGTGFLDDLKRISIDEKSNPHQK